MTDASTFFPGQLYQNPDGSFSLNITGHVHAAGLDLDAGTTNTPPDTDRVRWLRQGDGAVVADIFSYDDGVGRRAAFLETLPSVGTVSSDTFLSATATDGSFAEINVTAAPGGATVFAKTSAPGGGATVWTKDGASLFVQLAGGSHGSQIWSGAIVGTTGGVRLLGTGQYIVSRTAVGTYTLQILLSGLLPSVWPIPVVQCNESVGAIAEVDYTTINPNIATFTVKTFSGPFGFGLADINWSFVALADQN